MHTPRPIARRWLPLLSILACAALLAPGCKQGEGEVCQLPDECGEGLECCGAQNSGGSPVRLGICLPEGDPTCDREPPRDGGPDAGAPDAGPDEADAGADAGPDEADAGTDAGPDEEDAGPGDAGPADAGPMDAGSDAGADDAGMDGG